MKISKNILISSLGSSKGLLYSALKHIKPDIAIIVTSTKYKRNVEKVCQISEQTNFKIIIMNDVFCGFNEAPVITNKICDLIPEKSLIKVNLTGGTTAMQWAMQHIYENLSKNKNLQIERVAFIDRRPMVEQQNFPWVVGEIFYIDSINKNNEK